MTKTQNMLLKRAVIRGIIANSSIDSLDSNLSRAVTLLLNEPSVKNLKPFNLIRNTDMLNDETGLVQEWFDYLTRSIRSESVEIMAGKRVKRGIEGLSRIYDEYLPESIRGVETLAVLFRVFYMDCNFQGNALAHPDLALKMTLSFITTLLRTMLLLEMISDNFEVHGKPADYWLEFLLMGASTQLGDIQSELTHINMYKLTSVVAPDEIMDVNSSIGGVTDD